MSEPAAGPVRPSVALVLALVGFFALAICGLGLTSLITGAAVIDAPGLGQVPGAVGMAGSTLGVALALWTGLRRTPPSYWTAASTALGAFLGYLVGFVLGAAVAGADLAASLSAAGSFALSWFAVVLAGAGVVAGWSAVALVRTRAERPRWPWEDEEE